MTEAADNVRDGGRRQAVMTLGMAVWGTSHLSVSRSGKRRTLQQGRHDSVGAGMIRPKIYKATWDSSPPCSLNISGVCFVQASLGGRARCLMAAHDTSTSQCDAIVRSMMQATQTEFCS